MLLSLLEKTVDSTAITGKNRAILQELILSNDFEATVGFLIDLLEKQEVNHDKLTTVFVNKICRLTAQNEALGSKIIVNEGV